MIHFPYVNVTLYIEKRKTKLLSEEVDIKVVIDVNVDIDMVKIEPNKFLSRKIFSQVRK